MLFLFAAVLRTTSSAESLTVPSEEPGSKQGNESHSEEVVASVETGEPDSNFIITATTTETSEVSTDKLAENVESEAAAVIEEGPSEIEDEFDNNSSFIDRLEEVSEGIDEHLPYGLTLSSIPEHDEFAEEMREEGENNAKKAGRIE